MQRYGRWRAVGAGSNHGENKAKRAIFTEFQPDFAPFLIIEIQKINTVEPY
jgi:hypothetical protein